MAELAVVASPERARELTDQIKVAVEATWHLIAEAYTSRAWAALGYTSWDDYCTREFGTSRLRLPREDRQEVIGSLRDAGLSIRAIATATGISKNTVTEDLRKVSQFGTPRPSLKDPVADAAEPEELADPVPGSVDLIDELDEVYASGDPEALTGWFTGDRAAPAAEIPPGVEPEPYEAPSPVVIGTDGKTYKASRSSTPAAPRRRPWGDAYSDAVSAVEKATTTLKNLASDNRATTHSEQAIGRTNDLLRAIDALTGVANQLR